jgi:U3 small nucleolar RNA-associated protein 23
VVGPANKHRYVVASQDEGLRKTLRGVVGVPLLHVRRSVMIMEPMARATAEFLESGEKAKFRGGLVKGARGAEAGGNKRKREEEEEEADEEMAEAGEEGGGQEAEDEGQENDGDGNDSSSSSSKPAPQRSAARKRPQPKQASSATDQQRQKKKRKYGVKGPNPLSVKKPKKRA